MPPIPSNLQTVRNRVPALICFIIWSAPTETYKTGLSSSPLSAALLAPRALGRHVRRPPQGKARLALRVPLWRIPPDALFCWSPWILLELLYHLLVNPCANTLLTAHGCHSPRSSSTNSCSVVSESLRPHVLWPARRPCPWDSPGRNTGVGGHALLHSPWKATFLTSPVFWYLIQAVQCGVSKPMWDEDTPRFTVPLLPESLLTMGFVSLTKVLLLFKRLGIKMFRNNNFFDSMISPIFMMGTRLPLLVSIPQALLMWLQQRRSRALLF